MHSSTYKLCLKHCYKTQSASRSLIIGVNGGVLGDWQRHVVEGSIRCLSIV